MSQAPDASPAAGDLHAGALGVVVDAPRHAGMAQVLDYLGPDLPAGTLVRVPLGKRTVTGIVWRDGATELASGLGDGGAPARALRPIHEAWTALAPLPASWRQLVTFAAHYYHRSLGEMALMALPAELRQLDAVQLARRLKRLDKALAEEALAAKAQPLPTPVSHVLTPEQASVLQALEQVHAGVDKPGDKGLDKPGDKPEDKLGDKGPDKPVDGPSVATLLWGSTGSGKTEVYLRRAQHMLDAGRQVLVMVPEINLTPQLQERLAQRFAGRQIVALHSGLTSAQRLRNWLLAHLGKADVVLGTRLSIFTPMPRLGLIVVDEEHDASYKQQDGARYSARDLAVYRGRLDGAEVLLGSATPSLETWHNALSTPAGGSGRYRRLDMRARVGLAAMPRLRLLDLSKEAKPPRGQAPAALAPALLAAIAQRVQAGEQCLILLNRRGYAPVLHCPDCGWKSACDHCSAWRVFHKSERLLRCHHCGSSAAVPHACPACGNLDIQTMGRGTQRLQEQLAQALPQARVGRIDADVTRHAGQLSEQLNSVHAGEIDVLVGTQMVAKGHDFRRITLVAAVNPDAALFSSDFRAAEREFALLLQAAGRAGRDAEVAQHSEMWIQTWHPQHPLYQALRRYDYEAFAQQTLDERQAAGLPPYVSLVMLRAEAKTQEAAQAFLEAAAQRAQDLAVAAGVMFYPPVPTPVQRVADLERAQMLLECASRASLHKLLSLVLDEWMALAQAQRRLGLVRWAVDVDPLSI